MSYAQPSDVINRYPNRDLVQLTNEDPTADTVNTTYIQQFLNDASSEIDTYLEARFTLPLGDPPAALNEMCTTIAMYKMQALRPLHDLDDARKRYEDVIGRLTLVSEGKLTLGISQDSQEPPQAVDSVRTADTREDRQFSRDKLKGY